MKKIVLIASAMMAALCANAAEYTFNGVVDNRWSIPENWTPTNSVWDASCTGIVANATAHINNWPNSWDGIKLLGDGTVGYAVIRIDAGGKVYRQYSDMAVPHSFILNGGELEFAPNYSLTLGGWLEVTAPSILRFSVGGACGLQENLRGTADLTINKTDPNGVGNATYINNNFRFTQDGSGYSGDIYLNAPIYIAGAGNKPIGMGTVYVGPGGGLYLGRSIENNIVLRGGALRCYGNSPRVTGTLTLEANAYLDIDRAGGNYVLYVDGDISGPHNIILGGNDPNGVTGHDGFAYFSGDNTGWTGGLIGHKDGYLIRFDKQDSLPRGKITSAIHSATGMRLRLRQNSDWTLTNALTGTMTISMRADDNAEAASANLLTLANTVVTPSCNPATTGTLTVHGRVLLDNTTLRIRLQDPGSASGNSRDLLVANASGSLAAVSLVNAKLDAVCEYDAGKLDVVVIVQNNTANLVSGVFKDIHGNDLEEDDWVDLGNDREAQITYAHTVGGNATSIALKNFRTSAAHVKPELENPGASQILSHSVVLNGLVTAGTPMPEVYFCWGGGNDYGDASTNAWPNVIAIGGKSGAFETTLYGLVPESNYVYRCYAVNLDKTDTERDAWSDPKSFTTRGLRKLYWTNTVHTDSTAYNWKQPYWDNAVPSSSGDTGYITNGTYACISGDLGVPNNYASVVVGGTLVYHDPAPNTHITLDGGSINFNWREFNTTGGLTILSDSTINIGATRDGSGTPHGENRKFSKLAIPAGVTLTTTTGAFSLHGDNPDLLGTIRVMGEDCGFTGSPAIGSASFFLGQGVRFYAGVAWDNIALNLANSFAGFGAINTGNNASGATLSGVVTPGDFGASTGGVFTVNSRRLVLTGAASLNINLWGAGNHGTLRVTSDIAGINIDLSAKPALNLNVKDGFKTKPGDEFVILLNTGANAISGRFANYPDATNKVVLASATASLIYNHPANGTAYNIVLTNIRPNGTLFMLK